MTEMPQPGTMACPGCAVGVPDVAEAQPDGPSDIALSLPDIHCHACIRNAEAALGARADVVAARVNLTLRRAYVQVTGDVTAEDLVETLRGAGIAAHELDGAALHAGAADRAGRDLLMRLAVAGFASMNVMLLSVAVWSGATDATRDLFHWISAAIALPAIAFCAQPFFGSAWTALKARALNMDVPIALAIVLALGTSLYETAMSGEHAYFDAALTLCFFLLAGRYLEFRTRAAARSAAQELTALEVPRALLPDGSRVAVADLSAGDVVLVRPGGRLPVDGVVVQGASELDRSLLSGETVPVAVGPGAVVQAGEINLTGPLEVRATATGAETSLHRLADLVAVAEAGRANYTGLADRAAALYAPGVHILAALSFVGWLIWAGDVRVALNIAAAVLIITCPCALGLAVPAVTTAASGRLFRKGVLIKNGTALERLAGVDTVVFDKTGTLTCGAPVLRNAGAVPEEARAVAKALAAGSAHPLAQAIAAMPDAAAADVTEITEVPGLGTQGIWRGRQVRLGRAGWAGADAQAEGLATWVDTGDGRSHVFTFDDAVRDGATELVATLQAQGLRVVMMSGDARGAVDQVARATGIDEAHAAMRPEDKCAAIAGMQAQGARVLMVGDGLNDTAALAGADVSISPATALDAARVASDMVLLGQDLRPIGDAVTLARRATARIKENFRIATLYNVIAVPLAVAGLATPLIAALAMSASSITVSLNALRLGTK